MPTKLVKQYNAELLPLLMHIINHSIATGEFPKEWKTAYVMTLLKKAGLDPIQKNYRPVLNLQYVSKLTKRAVVTNFVFIQIVDFLCHHVSLHTALDILKKLLWLRFSLTFF